MAINGSTPHAEVIGIVGVAALVAKLAVALYRFHAGDVNMRQARAELRSSRLRALDLPTGITWQLISC